MTQPIYVAQLQLRDERPLNRAQNKCV